MFRELKSDKIVATISELDGRIKRRFPGAGLARICGELLAVAKEAEGHIDVLARPNYWLRGLLALTLLGGIYLLTHVRSFVEIKFGAENLSGILQFLDAGFNVLVVMGAGALFLTSLEARWKRQLAMEYLHDLRSIVHVIDMAQLSKDPSADRKSLVTTADGGEREMSDFELKRYLDYCSEMLSLAGKVAALYAQSTRDDIVIDAVSDIGQLTTNMSGKLWQKISILQVQTESDEAAMRTPLPAISQQHQSGGAA